MNPVDLAYFDILRRVLNASPKEGRNGLTYSCFSEYAKFDLSQGFPILTTKKIKFDLVVQELLWYLSGESHIRNLQKHTSIWDTWGDERGNLETAYGRYWRFYPVTTDPMAEGEALVKYDSQFIHEYPEGSGSLGFDQLAAIINELRVNPNSRRLVMLAWYPPNAWASKLPPCHVMTIFNVIDGKLSCHLTQRSGDLPVGVPWNWSCYSLLTHLLAQEVGLDVGYFSHLIADAHIYANQIEAVKLQLEREAYPLPRLVISPKPLSQLEASDITLEGYQHQPFIRFEVSA